MRKKRLVIELVPNLQMRQYGISSLISESSIESFERPFRNHKNELKECGWVAMELLGDIFQIEGVEQVFIHPYEFSVKIGKAFEWADIEPGIISAILAAVFKDAPEGEVEIYSTIPDRRRWEQDRMGQNALMDHDFF